VRLRLLPISLLAAAVSLPGQYRSQRHSWQNDCFNNPRLPYCMGHESAVKPERPEKDPKSGSGYSDPLPPPVNVTQAEIAAGAIDWRFADPSADTLIGFHARKLSAAPMARAVIAQLAASQKLIAADNQKLFENLSNVDQVAVSIRENETLIMATGRKSDTILPQLDPDWKVVPVARAAIVIGPAAAVDQALQRMAADVPPTESMRWMMKRQASTDFWRSGAIAVPPAAGDKLRSVLTVSIDDHFSSDLALEFPKPPDAATLAALPPALKGVVENNVVHVRASAESEEVQPKLSKLFGTPTGDSLGALITSTRYLPVHDPAIPKQARPVIYGLEGGPQELNH
jgi:hypothetical protein